MTTHIWLPKYKEHLLGLAHGWKENNKHKTTAVGVFLSDVWLDFMENVNHLICYLCSLSKSNWLIFASVLGHIGSEGVDHDANT